MHILGLYDLMFAWSHFEADLPDTLTEFKRVVHNKFPKLYDTKVRMYMIRAIDEITGSLMQHVYHVPVLMNVVLI